jgi:enoyl-CoA hydratase/3-hydroxyacyl-CoA dehydrogenase
MPLTLFGRTIHRVAIIGSGNIGPDIALFFSRTLAPYGVSVVVNDVLQSALDAGRRRVQRKLEKGHESGLFKPSDIEVILKNLTFTLDRSLLVGCDLAIEAATERLQTKQQIFEELERLVSPHAILASNSSHLTPEQIFEKARRPERTLIHHFFFPAERNPLVEIVSGPRGQATEWSLKFYEAIGKVPIRVRSRYGFAVNPLFEGLFLAALLAAQTLGVPPGIVDAISCRALGLGAGPFSIMNLTGGNPLTQSGLRRYHDVIMPWFHSPKALDEKVAGKESWETIDKGDTLSYSNAVYENVSRQLLGAYFGLACEVLESGIANLGDLEMGAELGLAARPPFALMNELGPKKVRDLVERYASQNPGFRVPREFGPWTIPHVFREDREDVAVLTIKRPRTLNALNREVYRQLDEEFGRIQADPKIKGAVVTGFGTKAFVSGADVSMLAALKTAEEAKTLSWESQQVLLRIENLGKPVVCALNGLSLGGGSELAYACTARIARKGVPMLFGQPEPKLGILPGAGGTQRLPRLIDFVTAWRVLRTAGSISGPDALRLGLVLEEVEPDRLIDRAAELARTLKPRAPLPPPRIFGTPPEVDLGGLSRKVDEILRKAILQGAAMPLERALQFESACFGEAFATRDRQIGLENFLRTNLKQPAVFVHA